MGILFKSHATGETTVVDYEEFKRRIRQGEIVPEDQVKDRILSDDEWRTMDEVRIFHKLAPVQYPKGPLLRDREAVERWMRRRSEQESTRRQKEFKRSHSLARRFFREEKVGLSHVELYEFLVRMGEPPLAKEEFAVRLSYGVNNFYNNFVCVTLRSDKYLLRCPARTKTLSCDSNDVRRLIKLVDAVDQAKEQPYPYGYSPVSLICVMHIWTVEIAQHRRYRLKSLSNPMEHIRERGLRDVVALSRHLKKLSRSDRPRSELKH